MQRPMCIFDRYLLHHFLRAYLICLTSLIGLYLVIDAFTNLDEFSEHKAGVGSVLQHMGGYYAYRVSLFFDRLAGIIGMMAAIFTLVWLARHGELMPMLAAGVPMYRIAAPVVGAAILASGLQVANQEWIIPRIRDRLLRGADDLTGNKPESVAGRYDNRTGVFIGGGTGYPRERRIADAYLILPGSLAETLTNVQVQNAYYVPGGGKNPSGWKLIGTEPAVIKLRPEGRRYLYPLTEKGGQYFFVSDLSFDHVTRQGEWFQYASTAELIQLLHSPSASHGLDEAVTLHTRLVRPLLNLLLLMVSLPLTLSRQSRNFFLSMGISLIVAAAFFGIGYVCQYLGTLGYSWFPPALAAWAPVILFGSTSIALWDRVIT